MNGNTIGSLLLALGTVFGALAAANSHKSGKYVELPSTGEMSGEFVLHDVVGDGGEVLLSAGTELTAEAVARLRKAGLDRVQIRVPSRPTEEVSGAEAMTGRVLARDVVVSTEPRVLEAGTRLGYRHLRELREGGIETLLLEGEDGPVPIGADGTFDLRGKKLAEEIAFDEPTKIAAGSFLTEARVQTLLEAGIDRVTVRVPKRFHFADWEQGWVFFAGVLLMIGGIALKRGAADDPADEAGPSLAIGELRAKLEEVTREVAALAERADDLDSAELHRAVDGILTEGCYPIVESRQVIATALGQAGFARVMSSFSSGERRLNRAWSAAVDDYPAEARLSVREAAPFLEEALAALRPA